MTQKTGGIITVIYLIGSSTGFTVAKMGKPSCATTMKPAKMTIGTWGRRKWRHPMCSYRWCSCSMTLRKTWRGFLEKSNETHRN